MNQYANSKTPAQLTQARLKELYHYNPDTGMFFHLRLKRFAGSQNTKGYLKIEFLIDGRRETHYCHRLAWLYMTGEWPVNLIDHINGKKYFNRFSNLRDVTNTENLNNLVRSNHD